MPRRELKNGGQVANWLQQLGESLSEPGEMILIGSSALLLLAYFRGITAELPEASMAVDPITDSDAIARICYESMMGSDFEREHGWHVNLMPRSVLNEFPADWKKGAVRRELGRLTLLVPSPHDLLVPKLKRAEPRDLKHWEWARQIGLIEGR